MRPRAIGLRIDDQKAEKPHFEVLWRSRMTLVQPSSRLCAASIDRCAIRTLRCAPASHRCSFVRCHALRYAFRHVPPPEDLFDLRAKRCLRISRRNCAVSPSRIRMTGDGSGLRARRIERIFKTPVGETRAVWKRQYAIGETFGVQTTVRMRAAPRPPALWHGKSAEQRRC